MKLIPALAAVAAFGLLTACNEEEAADETTVECTQELVTQKSTDLQTKIQELAASDPQKVADLLPKIQEIATQAAAAGEDDLSGSCKALDDIMAELEG